MVVTISAWVCARAGLVDDPVLVLELVHVLHPGAWRPIPGTICGAPLDSWFGLAAGLFKRRAVIICIVGRCFCFIKGGKTKARIHLKRSANL